MKKITLLVLSRDMSVKVEQFYEFTGDMPPGFRLINEMYRRVLEDSNCKLVVRDKEE